jgi:ABC-type phosphate transport system permease subunit
VFVLLTIFCFPHPIVVGLFVYTIVVAQMQHFSGWAGVIALALLQVPIVIRTTENMLKTGAGQPA